MTKPHFAYGSNMVVAQMAARCPHAVLLGPARAENVAFRIGAAGYATLVPEAGSTVLGVLWELTAADEAAIDRYEDLDAGLYHKTDLTVTAEGGSLKAMVYLATDPTPGRPQPGYLESVLEAATAHGFPEDYRAGLAGWL